MRYTSIIACVLVAAALVAGGCSRQRTVVTPMGNATVTQKPGGGQTVEMNAGQGKVIVSTEKKTISEKELGVPVYPGAIVEVSGDYQGMAGSKGASIKQHMLTTPDDFDKVEAFYKANLKGAQNVMSQKMGDQSMAMFMTKAPDGKQLMVHVIAKKGENGTKIQVMAGQ